MLITAPGFRRSGVLLHPGDIQVTRDVIGIVAWSAAADREGRTGARIAPAMDFGMAIAKGQAGCEVVVKTREILTKRVRRRSQGREPIHVGQIISPVNNVFPFVQKEKRFRGSRRAASAE